MILNEKVKSTYIWSFDPIESPGEQYPGTDENRTEKDELVEHPDSVDDPDKEPVEDESDRE